MREAITAQQIIDLLPIVADRGWYVTDANRIRDAEGFCPICALGNEIAEFSGHSDAVFALLALGVKTTEADLRKVVIAADTPVRTPFRQQMIQILGAKRDE